MWHRRSVEKFLADQKVEPAVVEATKARMTEVADRDGLFDSSDLNYVMGDLKLARAYEQAWQKDSSLHQASFTTEIS